MSGKWLQTKTKTKKRTIQKFKGKTLSRGPDICNFIGKGQNIAPYQLVVF